VTNSLQLPLCKRGRVKGTRRWVRLTLPNPLFAKERVRRILGYRMSWYGFALAFVNLPAGRQGEGRRKPGRVRGMQVFNGKHTKEKRIILRKEQTRAE